MNCEKCGEQYDQQCEVFAYRGREMANGCGGRDADGVLMWYGRDGERWPVGTYEERETPVFGVEWPWNRPYCPKCVAAMEQVRERAQEYTAPCPPAWFDEANAGERWDDDY